MASPDPKQLKTQKTDCFEGNLQTLHGRDLVLAVIERADKIADSKDGQDFIHSMLDLMIEITQADSAHIFISDSRTDEYELLALRGDPESQYLVGLRLKRHHVLPGISIDEAQPVVIGDLSTEPLWLGTADPSTAITKRNVINLPIQNKTAAMGVIQIFNYRIPCIDVLQVLSRRLAIELAHRREIDKALRSNQRYKSLVEILGKVAGTLDRNRLLYLVTENASQLVGAERSSIFIVDPDTNDMIFQVGYRSEDQDKSAPVSKEEDRASQDEPIDSTGRQTDTQTKSSFEESAEFSFFNRSAITAPLRSRPLAHNHAVDRKYILGGLMVHNMQDASFQEEDAQLIEILANQTSTFLQVAEMYESSGELFLGVIKALAAAIDAKDPYTQGHSKRVSDYATLISQELGLDQSLINDIQIGSLLHDIGKIGIPDSILLKEGKLTADEFEIIKQHPSKGENILKQVELLAPVLPAISEHHERPNGSGYPNKLVGRQVSLMGRIVAVADVFDAMTSDRPYRPAYSVQEVLDYLKENVGGLFDHDCVQALEKILTKSSAPGQ